MDNKKLPMGAVIVVLLAGLYMYLTKESESQPVAEQVQEQPVAPVAQETAPVAPVAEPVQPAAPIVEEAPVHKSLGASSSGLGR